MTKMTNETMKIRGGEEKRPEKPETAPKPELADESIEPKEDRKTAKESYDDYIKALPPPFWETKRPPRFSESGNTPPPKSQQDRSAQEIAASINAVCAPMSAADREEDARRSSRTMRERWKDWKSKKERKNSEPDLRPMERGSRARLNVFGSVVTDKKGR